MKMPDVRLTNDTAWTTLEAITMSKKVFEALLRQKSKGIPIENYYWEQAEYCIGLCEKARALWAKGKKK